MGLTDAIAKLADPYERQARLYPALLAISPLALAVFVVFAPHYSLIGGLASAIDEIARGARCMVELDEPAIPISEPVRSACDLLGLDPLAMANEGRMLVICAQANADQALSVLQGHHRDACRIGFVQAALAQTKQVDRRHPVRLRNRLGVLRPLDLPRGEELPRIC